MADLSLLLRSLTYTKQAELVTMNNYSAYSINLSKKVNTPNSLSFNIPATAPHYSKIIVGASLVEFENEMYIVRSNKITKDDNTIAEVSCEHLSSNLAYIRGGFYEYQAEKVSTLVNAVLKDTNWSLGETDIADSNLRHLISSNETVLANLLTIAENFGAVCTFTSNSEGVNKVNFYVNKKERGFYITNTKNMQGFTLNYETTDLVTRLWAWGAINKQTGIQTNILSLTDNKGYIEDYSFYTEQGYSIEYIQAHPELFLMESELNLDDVSDEQTLYDLAVKELDKRKYPKTTLSVNVLDLSQVPKYYMEKPDIYENAILIDETLNLRIEATIVGFNKNYDDDLGMSLDISDTIEYSSFMSDIIDKVDKNDTAIKDIDMGWKDVIEQSRNELGDMINSGLGGYVLLKPDEILIMDTDNISTCKNIWRWNKNALAFSSNGYHGQYTTGLDMLGRFNADIITTGKLNAAIIKTGLLSSLNNTTWINMDNGEFNFANKIKFIDNQFTITLENGNSIEDEIYNNNQNLNNKIDEVDQKIDSVLDDVGGALADGVISEAEASMIKLKLLDFEKEKAKIDNEYKKLYNNVDLIGVAKSNLLTAYNNYTGSYNDLINTINLIIADNEATESEKANYETKVKMYNSKFSIFATMLQEALNSITDKKKADGIEYTNSQIEVTKDEINLSVSSIYEKKEDVEKKIENITIGTINLIDNSTWNFGLNIDWTTNNNFSLLSPESNKPKSKIIHYNKSGLTSVTNSQKWCKEIEINTDGKTQYTISFDFKTIDKTAIDSTKLIGCLRAFDELGLTSQVDSVWYNNITVTQFDSQIINNKWTRISYTFAPTAGKYLRIAPYMNQNGVGYWREFKLEKGNKFTDYSKSENDISKEIDTGITQAKDDLSKEITEVNSSLSDFQNTVNTTFKDGVINEAEALAIGENVKKLNTEKTDIDNKYTTIYGNSDLTGSAKTNLLNAKNDYNSKHSSLITTINNAISDKKITTTERNNVNTAFSNYNTSLGVLSQRFEQALDSISSKKKNDAITGATTEVYGNVYKKTETYTKNETNSAINVAKEEINLGVSTNYETKTNVDSKISGIKVGGKNLIPYTDLLDDKVKYYKPWGSSCTITYSKTPTLGGIIRPSQILVKDSTPSVAEGAFGIVTSAVIGGLESGKEYTLSFRAMSRGNTGFLDYIYILSNESGVSNQKINIENIAINSYETHNKVSYVTFKPNKDYPVATILIGRTDKVVAETTYNAFGIWDIQLEEGNKYTSFAPCTSEVYEYSTNYTNEEVKKAKADIKITTDSITQNVSKLEKVTYEGSGNLVPNSNWKKGYAGWRLSQAYSGNFAYGVSGASSLKEDKQYIRTGSTTNNTYNSLYIDSPKFPVVAGESITVGSYCGRNTNLVARMYILFTDNTEDITVNNSFLEGYTSVEFTSTGYQKKTLTATAPAGAIRAFIRLRVDKRDTSLVTDSSATWSSLMAVRGESELPWTPNQEDAMLYTNEKVAEIKVTTDEIKSSISKVESDAANTYATKSSLTQTADSIVAKFEGSGGFNLIKNSRPRNSLYYWDSSNGTGNTSTLELHGNSENWNGERYGSGLWWRGDKTTSNWCNIMNDSLIVDKFKFATNKNYTVRFPIYSNVANKSMFVRIADKTSNNLVNNYNFTTINGYKMIEYTFNPSNSGNLPAFMLFLESTGVFSIYIPWVMICEGINIKQPWSGADGETYAGITEVNADGIKVSHSGTGNYSAMTSEGFLRYVNNSKKTYHYLISTGTVVVGEGMDATIQLPDEFKNKDFRVVVGAFKINIVYGWDSVYDVDSFAWNIDRPNGRFMIKGMVKSANQLQGTLDVSYTVIA